ncbi:MAG TPA: hypothetical protein VKU19_42500 [Bryobacteraceae bacterium]|nr:hypothetical protein [Bryobacteraceae bacterium]
MGNPGNSGDRYRDSATSPRYYCEEAGRLLQGFGEAVQELLRLHEQQFLAIVEGDLTANRFDLLIHEANQRKQNAKYLYMSHLEQHGCSRNDGADLS